MINWTKTKTNRTTTDYIDYNDYSMKEIKNNSLQDLHEVPEHLWSARKRHRSALCDALPDKESAERV